jgi:hypothetical protein
MGAIYTAAAQTMIAQVQTQSPTNMPVPINTPTSTAINTLTSTDTSAQTASPYGKVGQRIVQEGYALTVISVESASHYGYLTADAGKKLIALDVLIESGADQGVNVNPFYFKIKDSEGYQYNVELFGKDPALGSQNDLPNGEKMRGWVTFQIPATSKGLIMSYEPIQFSNTIRIRVDLGQ